MEATPAPSEAQRYTRISSARPIPSTVPASGKSRIAKSVAASRSAAVPGIGIGSKKLTFGSEWHFKDDGVKIIVQRFKKIILERFKNSDNATCYYDDDFFVWQILCLPSLASEIELEFLKLLRTLIKEEHLDAYESESDDEEGNIGYDPDDSDSKPKKSTKLIRLSVWKRQEGIPENAEIVAPFEPLPVVKDTPEELETYKARACWELGNSDVILDALFSDDVLQQIQDLTGCVLVLDIAQQKIFVGARSDEQCHRAIGKMDNIRKYAPHADMKNRPITHVLYTEGHEKVRYQFKRFAEVDHNGIFFLSTLLDNSQRRRGNDYCNLWAAATIRIAPWNHRSLPAGFELYKPPHNQAAATPQEQVDLGSSLFGPDFTFVSKAPEVNPLSHVEDLEGENVSAEYEPSGTPGSNPLSVGEESGDPVTAIDQVEETLAGFLADDLRAQNVLGDFRHFNGTYQSPGNTSVTGGLVIVEKPDWDTYTEMADPEKYARQSKTAMPNMAPKGIFGARLAAIQNPLARTVSAPVQVNRPASQAPASHVGVTQPHLIQVPTQQLVPTVQSLNTSSDNILVDSFNRNRATTVPESDSFSALDRAWPALQATMLPLGAPRNPWSVLQPTILHQHHPQNPPQPQTDRLQMTSEASTRVFHQTMNQRAPSRGTTSRGGKKPNPFQGRLELPSPPRVRAPPNRRHTTDTPFASSAEPVADPMPALCTEINVNLDKFMSGVRGFSGEVSLHAEFGRILLKRVTQHIADENHPHLFYNKDDVMVILQPESRIKEGVYCHPFFTRVLTTAAPDATVLVDMKDSKGNKLWGTQLEWGIMYQFLGHNAGALGIPTFIIEMDGEKNDFKVTIKKQRPLGEVYVHGTKRNWDFRISAIGNESLYKSSTDTYQPLADGIRETLYIPEKLTKPFLAFSLPDSISGVNGMHIDAVRVHRISKYLSADEKSVLKVSEIIDLDITHTPVPDKGLSVFKAVTPSVPRPGREKVNTWHEVNISSVAANRALLQNQTLELGDEASWTADSLSKSNYAESMYLPAFEMLRQMDGIGHWNDNDVDSRVFPVATQPAAPKFQYW